MFKDMLTYMILTETLRNHDIRKVRVKMEKPISKKTSVDEVKKYCLEQIELIDDLFEDSDCIAIDEETKSLLTGNRDAFEEVVMLINGEELD